MIHVCMLSFNNNWVEYKITIGFLIMVYKEAQNNLDIKTSLKYKKCGLILCKINFKLVI